MSNAPSPASSTAHLIQKPFQKDYSAALSNLQNSYGFGGSPLLPTSSQVIRPKTTTTSTSAPSSASPSRPKIHFTGILTSLGFGGGSSRNPSTITSKPSPPSSSRAKHDSPGVQTPLPVQNSSQMATPAQRK